MAYHITCTALHRGTRIAWTTPEALGDAYGREYLTRAEAEDAAEALRAAGDPEGYEGCEARYEIAGDSDEDVRALLNHDDSRKTFPSPMHSADLDGYINAVHEWAARIVGDQRGDSALVGIAEEIAREDWADYHARA